MRFTLLALLIVLLPAAAARAIQPGEWVHTNEADFAGGENDGTVITNLGDVKLAADTETLEDLSDQSSIIYDLEPVDDEGVYIATGPEAKLLKKVGDKIETVTGLPGEQIFALDKTPDGKLIAAISGTPSRLATIEDGKLKTLVELKDVRYIWDVVVQDDAYILATGTDGKVLRVRPNAFDAKKKNNPGLDVLLDAEQTNILCLAYDAPRNRLYAGTDTEGLVYRITFDKKGKAQPFVVYDAPEPEIGALAVSEDGTVYAGTADAEQARPGRLEEAQSQPAGRPGETQPAQPEKPGKPGEPEPKEPPKPGDLPQVPPEAEPIDGQPQQDQSPKARDAGHSQDDQANDQSDDNADDNADNDADADRGADDSEIAPPATQPQAQIQRLRALAVQATRAQDESKTENANDTQTKTDQPDAAANADANADGNKEADADQPTEPTDAQRDRLREVIRQRLQKARESGQVEMQAGGVQQADQANAAAPNRASSVQRERRTQQGNAIYRIDSQGFVSEVFRESVMILRIVEADGRLYVATGNEGQIYRIDPAAEETTMIVDLEPQQVPALLRGPNGGMLVGTANPAKLIRLDRQVAGRGTYTSPIMDATQISLWGKLRSHGRHSRPHFHHRGNPLRQRTRS